MGRHGAPNRFLDDWHRRHLDLDDGRQLTWTAMVGYRQPFADCFKVDRTPIHASEARRLLAEAGHPRMTGRLMASGGTD